MEPRHLFIDDHEVESIDGLTRVIHQPIKHSHPVIRCEQPWEMFGIQTYGTIIYDEAEQLFKAWYLTHAGPSTDRVRVDGVPRPANMTLLAYATSRDGIAWRKPSLGQVNFERSTNNNLLRNGRLNVEGASVLLEPEDTDPSRRYKAFYWEHGSGDLVKREDGSFLWTDGEGDGIWVSFSPNGIHWTNHPANPVIRVGSDTGQSVVWDPKLRLYVAYGRFGFGRRVARSGSPDFVHWSKPQLVLEPDERDGLNTQFYGISVTLYEGIYVGMLWVFHIDADGHLGGGKDRGTIDVQLASSRDGVKWERAGDRRTFIPNGPPADWDSRIIQCACRSVVLADKILIYYNGTRLKHGEGGRSSKSQIGLATLRRDGFVSLDAGDKEGSIITKPFRKTTGDLHLNVDAAGGQVLAFICDARRKCILGPSVPVTRDTSDVAVQWTDGPAQSLDGKTIRVLLRARNTKLYSYWFQ